MNVLHRLHPVWQRALKETPVAICGPGNFEDADVASMLRHIGIALVEVQQPTQVVRTRLLHIAGRYTTSQVRVVALPTVLMVQVGAEDVAIESSTRGTTRLDLAARVDAIARLAGAAAISPAAACDALKTAREMRPRFGHLAEILGYVITTVGFGVLINPTWTAVPWYALLGAIAVAIVVLAKPLPGLSAGVPAVAAFVVTVLAATFITGATDSALLHVVSPPLVALLPGLALTIGAMELASAELIAGASRVVYGLTQLMLLVFGVSLGYGLTDHIKQPPAPTMGPWTFYAAIIVVGFGIYLYLSAPAGSLLWLTAAVAVALVGQNIGGSFMPLPHAGALGAFLVVPFAVFATRFRGAPPTMVMLLAAFWALVPGALSFESIGEAAASGSLDVSAIATAVGAVFSIALGTLLGWGLYTAVYERRWAPK